LIVDDRNENLFALSTLLSEFDVEVFKAGSGAEALELMLDHDFALAILDIQMPDMDGFEVAELMRGTERTKTVPIIFVTAAAEKTGFAFRGYEKGAVDFLFKPIDPTVLKSKVRVFIELDEQKKLLSEKLAELQLAKEAAEAANRLKSSFLANMSHEIRTPLGAMIGFAELLEEGRVSPEEKAEFPRIIRQNGQSLLRLLDDVLDLSKVEAGRLEIEKIVFSPRELITEVLDLLRQSAEQKGIEMEMFLSPEVPERVISDPTRLRQILMNIIGNAIKFTRAGRVCVRARPSPHDRLRFEVEDTGVGIDGATAERLFRSFVQADNSTTRKFGGTGLGLALSRRLAQRLGGDVRLVHSAPGEGSCFEILVEAAPYHVPESRRAELAFHSDSPHPLKGLNVLLVEDSEDNRFLIEQALRRHGAAVEFACDGLAGVNKAVEGAFDLVLMDIQMPVLDGYGATKRLRELGYFKPVIALTAHAMAEERERCLSAGCDEHLPKPIDWPLLVDMINRLTVQRGKRATPVQHQ
jgi:signal transduction histidine kinase